MKTMFGKRYPNCVKKKKTRKEELKFLKGSILVVKFIKKEQHQNMINGENIIVNLIRKK